MGVNILMEVALSLEFGGGPSRGGSAICGAGPRELQTNINAR